MEGRKKMEEFYRKLKVGMKLKYAFTTVIVTFAVAMVVFACFHCNDECGYLEVLQGSICKQHIADGNP